MKFVLAIDSFKGCLSSSEIEEIVSSKLEVEGHEVVSLPVSDGGEGMLEAFTEALGGEIVSAHVHDPLGRVIRADFGITRSGIAIIETAKACGLGLMALQERNPLIASSYGVGELVAEAVKAGCRQFIIGLGGSGTSDAGKGMLRGLSDSLGGKDILALLEGPCLSSCHFTLDSDVRNPLFGPSGAARVFGPQKGATPEMIDTLDLNAREFALRSSRLLGRDCSMVPGSGAAGGLGYAFLQYLGAEIRSGADLLLDLADFDSLILGADVVITGEGHADRQTLMGKLPERVLRRCLRYGKSSGEDISCYANAISRHKAPAVWLLAGGISDSTELTAAGFSRLLAITPPDMPLEQALKKEVAKENIANCLNTVDLLVAKIGR